MICGKDFVRCIRFGPLFNLIQVKWYVHLELRMAD